MPKVLYKKPINLFEINRGRTFYNYANSLLDESLVTNKFELGPMPGVHAGKYFKSTFGIAVSVGNDMEKIDCELKEITNEVRESKKVLQDLHNEVRSIYDIVAPQLKDMIHDIRSLRTSLTMELNKALLDMKEIRKFFLESEYKEEMARIERFVQINEKLRGLIDDGTMDAITDVMLKLAVGNEEKGKSDATT